MDNALSVHRTEAREDALLDPVCLSERTRTEVGFYRVRASASVRVCCVCMRVSACVSE
jgi:hypothetical protein